jgi:hypothetical protein
MTQKDEMLKNFVARLRSDGYTDYYVKPFVPDFDSDWHVQDWHGRFLVLEESVTLELGGVTRTYKAGEWYEVPPDTRHREVFSRQGTTLCIARRSIGNPLREIPNTVSLADATQQPGRAAAGA